MKYTAVEEQIEYGLEAIEPSRTVEVNLHDLMYVHQTLQELNRFFHQQEHYPKIEDVEKFLGDMKAGGAYRAIHTCIYKMMPDMLPKDIDDAFGDGNRFDHPDPPYYYKTKEAEQAAS